MGFFDKFREKTHDIIEEVQEDITGVDKTEENLPDTVDELVVTTEDGSSMDEVELDKPSATDDMYEKVVVEGEEDVVLDNDEDDDIVGASVGDADYDDPELNHEGLNPISSDKYK